MAQFKTGELVRLKSGGPDMTVSVQKDDGMGAIRVYCDWFNVNHMAQSGAYAPEMLELVTKPEPTPKPKPTFGSQTGAGRGGWMKR